MNHDLHLRHRRSVRLQGYDYGRSGAYFITVCTKGRACWFGEILGEEMVLTQKGRIVEQCWSAIPEHFEHVSLGAFVVMPNHLHGVIWIADNTVGARHAVPNPQPNAQQGSNPKERFGKPVSGSIPTIIRSFKSAATRAINLLEGRAQNGVWQRNYHEHIIRDEEALNSIRAYIANNPARWQYDRENPLADIRTLDPINPP